MKRSLDNKKPSTTQQKGTESTQKVGKTYLLLLLKRLGDFNSSYQERGQAAVEVRQLLDGLDQKSVPAVWYSAHDLIDSTVPQHIRRAALELLYECIVRCEEDSLKVVFFPLVVNHMIELMEKNEVFELNSEVALLLSCLNAIVRDASPLLKTDDISVLTAIIDEIVPLTSQKNLDNIYPEALLQLMSLIQKLIKPVKEGALLGVARLDNYMLQMGEDIGNKFFCGVIDFFTWLMRNHKQHVSAELLQEIAASVIYMSGILNERKEEMVLYDMELLLKEISKTSKRVSFLEQLFSLNAIKPKETNKIFDSYVIMLLSKLRSNLIDNDTNESRHEIIMVANKLYQQKKDSILLKLILEILNVNSKNMESFVDDEFFLSTTKNALGLWQLIRLTLRRNSSIGRLFGHRIINKIFKNHGISSSIGINNLLQFTFAEGLSADPGIIVCALEAESGIIFELETLRLLVINIMVPSTMMEVRLRVWKLFINLARDAKTSFLSPDVNKDSLLTMLYAKNESLELNSEEATLFEELIYALIQELDADQVKDFIQDYIYPDIYDTLGTLRRRKSIVGAIGTFARGWQTSERLARRLEILIHGLIRSFIWSATDDSGFKCIFLYQTLIKVYGRAAGCAHADTLLDIARAMIRIRRDISGYLYFKNPSDAIGISSAFGRNKNLLKEPQQRFKWTFPESTKIIDDNLLEKHNIHVMFDDINEKSTQCVDIGAWLSAAIDTIEIPRDLEIYSYLLTHLCGQLSDITLFKCHHSLIDRFKRVICNHLTNSIPSIVPLGDIISISDLHSAYVRNLSAVLAYHSFQSKSFADELVNALVGGLTSWEKTLIPILHILTISCFEIPQSIQRYLTPILQHIQKRITSLYATASILEFFLALCESRKLISNLTIEEIKRVFAIIFKLIENSVDLKIRSKQKREAEDYEVEKSAPYQRLEYEIDMSPSTESFLIKESLAEFFQNQSFRALSSWFLQVNESCKLELMPFIIKNLQSLRAIKSLKNDATAYMDFFSRSRFGPQGSDNIIHGELSDSALEESSKMTRWIHDDGLISIRVHDSLKKAIVSVRKPSCNRIFEVDLSVSTDTQPSYDIFNFPDEDENSESLRSSKEVPIDPEQVLFQLLYIGKINASFENSFVKIPDVISFRRSINAFDRIPDVDIQKAGIVYIGPSQRTEEDVLRNTDGSYQYQWFLSQMGKFIKLDEVSKFFYTGGLVPKTDGEYALVWRDEITQIAYHTVTLMPNDSDSISMKKSHVGNDLVNIFYDESGLPDFNFNIIKSQFTFISIVITPQSVDCEENQAIADHYKVKMYRRSGTPGLLSCTHFKIIGKPNLSRYVRHACLTANAFAQKYCENRSSDACSIWGVRCKHLTTLRERVCAVL